MCRKLLHITADLLTHSGSFQCAPVGHDKTFPTWEEREKKRERETMCVRKTVHAYVFI